MYTLLVGNILEVLDTKGAAEIGHYSWLYWNYWISKPLLNLNQNIEQQLIHKQMSSGCQLLPDYRHTPANITELFAIHLKI